MSRRPRTLLFGLGACALGVLLLRAAFGLHPCGHYPGPYGDRANAASVYERHVTNAVSAVNFDLRGFDTLGEEFILFVSVVGVRMLLRRLADEREQSQVEQQLPPISDAVRLLVAVLAILIVVYGLYVVAHGQLTPGGGFQGGVILATAPLLVFLAGGFRSFLDVVHIGWVEIAEAAGAGAYAAIGVTGLAMTGEFLLNWLPHGRLGSVFSGGTIPLLNLATGLAVTSGFVMLLAAFFEETYRLGPGDP